VGAAVLVVVGSAAGGYMAQRATSPVTAASTTPAGYVSLNPGRILDTRPQYHINYAGSKPAASQFIRVPGVPGAAALAVNITLTETVGPGFLAAWDGNGPRPDVSIINSTFPGENIANFAVVPAAADGSFMLWTYDSTHIVVDLMGYFPGGSTPAPANLSATITGYDADPSGTFTDVSGIVTNGTAIQRDVRVDVRCPNGTVPTDFAFDLSPGATAGWLVECAGAFASGASILQVVDV